MSAVVDWDGSGVGGEGPAAPLAPAAFVPSVLDADHAPDDVAAWAAAREPGAAVLGPLTRATARGLSDTGRVNALLALDKHRAWVEAQQLRVIAQMSAAAAGPLDKDWVREDIASALRLSRVTAADRLEFARDLVRLPATMDALERGTLTVMHARALAEAVRPLPDDQAAAVETAALAEAADQTVGQFRKIVHRQVMVVTAPSAEGQHDAARRDRRVVFTPVADGMEELWALLPADRAAALRARLNAEARNCAPGDLRTADQRRADVLCDLADAGSVGDRLPAEHRIRPSVQVTVSLSTLLGLGDQPAELAGYGPIPAFLARRIAADPNGTWRRLLIDAAGQFLDYGRTTYRPPADLARHVIARDRTCCFPGCGQPATRCELDHCLDWAEGGATSPANMNALCARHHHLKHETGWNYTTDADGGTLWTAPTGHEYRRRPGRYPIDETLLFLERYPPPRPKLSRTQLPDGPDPPF